MSEEPGDGGAVAVAKRPKATPKFHVLREVENGLFKLETHGNAVEAGSAKDAVRQVGDTTGAPEGVFYPVKETAWKRLEREIESRTVDTFK